MRKLKLLALMVISLHLFSGCLEYCEDYVARTFIQGEEDVIPYHLNDTMVFINHSDKKEYHFYCSKSYLNLRDSSYTSDYYCENDGYFSVKSIYEVVIKSDLKIDSVSKLEFDISLVTSNSPESIFIISSNTEYSEMIYNYNPDKKSLQPTEREYREDDNITYFENYILNDQLYEDVYKLFPSIKYDGQQFNIDTIYYNSTLGILKVVSQNLNLDLVYSEGE